MRYALITLLMAGILIIFACKVGEQPIVENPVPHISSISPSSKVTHMPEFTLTVTGSGFLKQSVIYFNGIQKSTNYVNSAELNCLIEPGEIMASPVLSHSSTASVVELPVMVKNPAPGGGDSNTSNFKVNSNFDFQTPVQFFLREGLLSLPGYIIDGSSNINIFWTDFWYIGDSNGVFFGRTEDNGANWNTMKVMGSIINDVCRGYLAMDSQGTLYLVSLLLDENTYRREIFEKASTDNGVTWSSSQVLSDFTSGCCIDAVDVRIHVDRQDNLYVIWTEMTPGMPFEYYFGPGDVYMVRSEDRGVNWSDKVNLTDSIGIPRLPEVSSSPSGELYLSWAEPVGNGSKVFFSSSQNVGDTWNLPVIISLNVTNVWEPFMACDDNGNIDVAWLEYQAVSDCVKFNWRRSENGGGYWSNRTDSVVIHCDDDSITTFAIDAAGNINVVWVKEDITGGEFPSYFSRSINYGSTWTAPLKLTFPDFNGTLFNRLARILVDFQGNVKIIWSTNQFDNTYADHSVLQFSSNSL